MLSTWLFIVFRSLLLLFFLERVVLFSHEEFHVAMVSTWLFFVIIFLERVMPFSHEEFHVAMVSTWLFSLLFFWSGWCYLAMRNSMWRWYLLGFYFFVI